MNELCPACNERERGETIPLCLACYWRQAVDGLGRAVEVMRTQVAA